MDNTREDERKKFSPCCDPKEVADIITCLSELKDTIDCVLECTNDHSSGIKDRIILCKLLDEIRKIEAKLDNPKFGLKEIKEEIIEINDIVSNSVFGLKEIKNEVRDIEELLSNEVFGLNEIKNEIIEINDLLNNATFGIPELKNEIRIIENNTGLTNNLLTNEIFGLNEIKTEVRSIENMVAEIGNRSLTCANDSIRVCGEGVDNRIRTLRTDMHNVTAALPSASTQSQIGRLFSVAGGFDLTESNRGFILRNPANSGRLMYLHKIIGGNVLDQDVPTNNPGIRVAIRKNPTATVEVAAEERVLNLAFADGTSVVQTERANNILGTDLVLFINDEGRFSERFDGEIIVPPGQFIGVSMFLLNPAADVQLFADLTVIWYELDLPTP
ncbi:MAG: hypothetical protein GX348_05740 [Veillonellaceae bacterium]|nr:hypothetical protein [Veillonellaceae bacterium]